MVIVCDFTTKFAVKRFKIHPYLFIEHYRLSKFDLWKSFRYNHEASVQFVTSRSGGGSLYEKNVSAEQT